MSVAEKSTALTDDPLWYKDAIIYQLHVRAFFDSTGDGVGDFPGLTARLDYLQDLGVSAVWLLPFYPSPLKDDGFDIADYTDVNPAYGTLRDFKVFLREAHARGLRVITELVLNHTSDQHSWYQRARRSPRGNGWRDFYVWSDTPERYREARIIFKDFETSNWAWDPVAGAYHWHRFYSHQPDLNFENPRVRRSLLAVMDHWLKLGVDALRLDAVPYLYEREGTTCENLPETHGFLKELRRHIDQRFKNRMLLAEANQWPEDAIAYFGDGDECHTAFHFPLMPRLFMAIQMEDRYPIVDILQQTPPIPANCQWVLFLRNHDELTLEMVTDEERDYMYRVYALDRQARINLGIRRRLAPLLGNDRRKIELMNGLLFSSPGTPVIYYGDEIGMGDNIYLGDRDGVRTPMQWSPDRNAGFSLANPQKLFLPAIIDSEYHYESLNVETQRNNPHSLFWWMKRLIALRQLHPAFSRGNMEFLTPENSKVLAFLRGHEEESALVVANLSRFTQYVELDLARFEGQRPVEPFGRTAFPPAGKSPYFLTLGPYAFFWLVFEAQRADAAAPTIVEGELPLVRVNEDWQEVFYGRAWRTLEPIVRRFLVRRWFGGKARQVQTLSPWDAVGVSEREVLALIRVEYLEGEPEDYLVPLCLAEGKTAERLLQEAPQAAIARLHIRGTRREGVLAEAVHEPGFAQTLLEMMIRRKRTKARHGELAAVSIGALRRIPLAEVARLPSAVSQGEQSNTSIVYGERFVLKLFRRVEQGANPDLEIGRFLAGHKGAVPTPPLLGAIEYRQEGGEPLTLAVLHEFVPNEGTAWRFTLDAVGRYIETVLTRPDLRQTPAEPAPAVSLVELATAGGAELAGEDVGGYLQSAELLGRRTAELHRVLASAEVDPAFAPEPFTQHYQRSMYQSLRKLTRQSLSLLGKSLVRLGDSARADAEAVLSREKGIIDCFHAVVHHKIQAGRIRCHGDCHLGQVLFTGKDFVIIDFEGEPGRSLGERRIKRSPLRDVAGMIRSFHYAVSAAMFDYTKRQLVGPDDLAALRRGARTWYVRASTAFLRSYLTIAGESVFVPRSQQELHMLLHVHLLEKAILELAYELNNRPDWVEVPLRGILDLLDTPRCG